MCCGSKFQDISWVFVVKKECHYQISTKETAATRTHLDNFHAKMMPKKLWSAGNINVASTKKRSTEGITIIKKTHQMLVQAVFAIVWVGSLP